MARKLLLEFPGAIYHVIYRGNYIALHLKQRTQASNGWLAGQLHMGIANAVSHYVSLLRQVRGPGQDSLHQLTTLIEA